MLEQAVVQEFFTVEKPDYVLLAATRVGGIRANNLYPAEFIYVDHMAAACGSWAGRRLYRCVKEGLSRIK